MPIYEYKCQQCGIMVEKRQSVSDEPLTTCEKCHGKLEKQWSLSGFQFKGAGWYVTDYAGKKSPVAESTTNAEPASKSKDEATPTVAKETVAKPSTE
ncbi:zinc ribbon domain-containing protein [soil metagenome]